MATWYVGSADYTAVAQWAASHVYAAGAIVRQLASPASGSQRCFKTTAGGTSGSSEPVWVLTQNASSPTDGTITDWQEVTGTAWTAPHATIIACVPWIAAGDDIDVHSTHAATPTAANLSIAFPGTAAAPNRVYSCATTHSPAQDADLVAGATETLTGTGAFSLTMTGFVEMVGVTMAVGSGSTGICNILLVNSLSGFMTFTNCGLKFLSSGQGQLLLTAASSAAGRVVMNNTPLTFNGSVGSGISNSGVNFEWKNTPSALPGTTSLNILLTLSRASLALIRACDLSSVASGKALVNMGATSSIVMLRNCTLASGSLVTPPTAPGGSIELISCGSSISTDLRTERYTYTGTLTTDTAVTLAGGATDGVTPFSWRAVTTANARYQYPFSAFEIIIWVDTTGSRTATISCVYDSVADGANLLKSDVWMDVEYLGNASTPIGTLVTSNGGPTSALAIGGNLTASAGTWTGMSNITPRSITAAFTTNHVGYHRFSVKVAKPSVTSLRIDPKVAVS